MTRLALLLPIRVSGLVCPRTDGSGHDLRAGNGLVIGDDGEDLQGRTRQLARLGLVAPYNKGKIGRGAKCPVVADLDEIDPAPGIERLQLPHDVADVDAPRQAVGDVALGHGAGGRENQRLGNPGRLVKAPRIDAYFVYPEEMRHSKRVAVFRDFLVAELSALGSGGGGGGAGAGA